MTDTTHLIKSINVDLQSQIDSAYRELVRTRFNMNVDHFWGVRTPAIYKIAAKHFKALKPLSLDQRLSACEHLFATGLYEHRMIAIRWMRLSKNDFKPKHLQIFTNWLNKYIDDWTDCDAFCIQITGEFFLKFPEQAGEVLKWTQSSNQWMRRASAVSLVHPARKGHHLSLVFTIADNLLEDPVDLVRKGYGWLLKEASKTHPEEVFDYVMQRRETMPRVSLRYAIEKLPEQLKRQAMEKPKSKQ
jgi:3-methyladenine DNA glycosylase AlkD